MSRNRKRPHGKNGDHEQPAAMMAVPAPVFAPFPGGPYASAQVLHDRNASVANVSLVKRTAAQYDPPEWEYKASGSAKRERGDVHDEGIGELLALSRAFGDLSRQLQREAARRVRASAKAENERRDRVEEKRAKAAAPPVHRTLAEWEEIQRRGQQAIEAALARSLGLKVEQGLAGRIMSVASIARPTADGRMAVMLADEIAVGESVSVKAKGVYAPRHEKTYVDCPEHGRREALVVPGLTGAEPVCEDCV